MSFTIRNFKSSDFPMISSWWKESDEIPPSLSMLPEESTLILEIDNKPAFCLSIYFTNCKEYSYLGNFVSDRSIKGPVRKEASQKLMNTVLAYAQNLGYKNVICMTHETKLQKRYQEMGFSPTISNVQTFVRKVI